MWVKEEKNISLDSVKKIYGAWSGYYSAKLIDITVQNSFSGGMVKINNSTVSTGTKTVDWRSHQSLEAVDRQNILEPINNVYYVRLFQYWMIPLKDNNYNSSVTIVPKPGRTYTAVFEKELNITFQNNFVGANGGQIKVNGIIQNAPFTTGVLARNPPQSITSEAMYQVINRIENTFKFWINNKTLNTVKTALATFYPNDHTTYTAHFNAKPLHPDYLYAGGEVGQPVRLTWQTHPHSNVTYEIWRKIDAGKGTPSQPPLLLSSLPRATTSYTDYAYTNTDGYTDDLVWYDVRSKFSLNNTQSDPWWVAAFATDGSGGGLPLPKIAQGEDLNIMEMSVPTNYQITSYPNPFNPTTVIKYALPNATHVTIKIYDLLGQEIITLVDEAQENGYRSVEWNGTNNAGSTVASGIYIYRLSGVNLQNSNDRFGQTKRMLLIK